MLIKWDAVIGLIKARLEGVNIINSFTQIFEAAIEASIRHHDKMRKGTDIPYISHPMSVALILARMGATNDAIIAGILHDTVEDSELTLEDISAQFGQRIADIVAACSEPDKKLSWKVRKEHTLEHLPEVDRDVWMVVCADKFHNASSMLGDYRQNSKGFWDRFNEGENEQKWYYQELVKALASGSHYCPDLYQQLAETVEELFGIATVG